MESLESIFGRIPRWLRWLLIPFVAALVAVLVWFLASIFSRVIVFFDGGRGWGQNFYDYLIVPGLSAFCAITVAVAMAPSRKNLIALLVGTFWYFLAGTLTVAAFLAGNWASLIVVLSLCVGSGIAVTLKYDEPPQEPQPSAQLNETSS